MSRDRARFQTTLSRAAVAITTRDRHDTRRIVVRVLEELATNGPSPGRPLSVEAIVAAVIWVAAEDPDVGEAIRNLASVFKLEENPAELETDVVVADRRARAQR